jgi:HK97 family phage major capsid protein
MTKTITPTDSAGLMELLTDESRLKEYFTPAAVANGKPKELFDSYAKDYLKRNPDNVDEVRDQVQSVLFDMIRSDGSKRGPKLGVNMAGGNPQLTVDGTALVSKGRGAVYNKTAPGAQLERAFKPQDRFNSIGEYCKAIFELRSPTTRSDRDELIRKLSNVKSFQNSFSSEEPGAGGFLIPEIMRSELLQLALEKSVVRQRATVIPMSTLRVPIPTVDDTSHVSSLFGGVVFYWTEEAAQLTESAATFGKVVLDAKKLTGFFKVPAELLDDAPAFAAWFDERVPMGFAWAEDLAFMTETGDGTPLGFINSPASVQVTKESGQTSGTIVWENIVKMYARMLPTSLPSAVWVASIDTFPQLATMALSVGTGGGPVWIGNYAGGQGGMDTPPMTILGRPVLFTEKSPALGTTGDINFVDLSYYLIGDRQQVRVDSSEHFLFQNNQVAYRIISRVDGRPWLQSPLTPHNGSSSTLSPFVQIAAR